MLNLGTTSGSLPFVKFNAKTGTWSARLADGVTKTIGTPTFLAAFEEIRTGAALVKEGQAPIWVFDVDLKQQSASPSAEYKRGFALPVFSREHFGGLSEFSSTSIYVGNAIKEFYAEWEAKQLNHLGKVPVVACTSTSLMKDRHGTNHKPIFTLLKWIDRPADFSRTDGPMLPTSGPMSPSPAPVDDPFALTEF